MTTSAPPPGVERPQERKEPQVAPGQYDATLAELADYGVPEETIEALKGSTLRAQLEEATKKASEADTLRQELDKVRKAPVRETVFAELGIDYKTQPRYAQKTLDQFTWEGDKPDPEAAAKFLQDEGFDVESPGRPAAADIVDQAARGGTPTPTSDGPDYSEAKDAEDVARIHDEFHNRKSGV